MHDASKAKSTVPPPVYRCYIAMDRAIKTHSLYLGKGRLSADSLIEFHRALRAYLVAEPGLMFEVTPYGLTYEGEVLVHGDRPSPYYFDLFRDGVREIAFVRGIDASEIRAFFEVVSAHVHEGEAAIGDDSLTESRDQDTVTRLWEAELTHVQYYAIDAYATGEVFDPERGELTRIADAVASGMARYSPARARGLGKDLLAAQPTAETAAAGAVVMRAGWIAPAERRAAAAEDAARDDALAQERFAVVWARLIALVNPPERERLAAVMVSAVRYWYAEGRWEALVRLLDVLQVLVRRPALSAFVRHVLDEVARPTTLALLQEALNHVRPEDAPLVLRYFRPLGPTAAQALWGMLADHPPGEAVDAIEGELEAMGGDTVPLRLARLGGRDSNAVRDAACKLRGQREAPGVADALRAMLRHPQPAIRHEVLQALDGDTHPLTLAALGAALTDDTPELRSLGIRALGRIGGEVGAGPLLERAGSKGFKAQSPGERRLVLTTLARVGGERVDAWFERELHHRTLFGGRKGEAWRQELAAAQVAAKTPSRTVTRPVPRFPPGTRPMTRRPSTTGGEKP